MSEIVLEKVTKAYGRVKAVNDVSFRAVGGRDVTKLSPEKRKLSMVFPVAHPVTVA